MTDLVILAGGKGLRLGNLTKKNQKTMLNFSGISFLRYLLNYYCKYNINKIFIVTSFQSKDVFKQFHKKKINLVDIICINQKKPTGTAKALLLIKEKVSNKFILVNGDTFFETDLEKLINTNLGNALGCMILTQNKREIFSKKLNSLSIKNNHVQINKRNNGLVNSGVMILSKKIFTYFKKKSKSFENDVLEKCIVKNKILGFKDKCFFLDIGSKFTFQKGQNLWDKKFRRPAIFLDRDGVINNNKDDYNYKISNFSFKRGIVELINKFYRKKYYIFIITNQAGIAKGKYTEKDFLKLQSYIKKRFIEKKLKIDHVEYCPHHPKGIIKKYKKTCQCRKPKNGMLNNILNNWKIDKKSSLFIGDKITDEMCAKKSMIKFLYFKENLFKEIY